MADSLSMLTQLRAELANTQIKERQLMDAIAALERLVGQGESLPDPSNPAPFANMTYADGVYQLLTEHGALSTRDLAELLLRGGVKTRARNFVATLYTSLYKDGRFRLRDDERWEIKGKK